MSHNQGFHLLLADDDADDAALLQRAFARGNGRYSFHVVDDGEGILDYLRRMKQGDADCPTPDMLFLDINMPRINGYEVLAALRGNDFNSNMPVAVLSTSQDIETIKRAYSCGANCYLAKPGTFADMVAMVASFEAFWFKAALLPDNDS